MTVNLDERQALEVIKSPKHKLGLDRAIFHESRVRFHSEIYLSHNDCKERNSYYDKYLQRVSNILMLEGKLSLFKSLLIYPFATQGTIVEKVMSAHEKVFKAQDSFVDYGFNNKEKSDDFEAYLESIEEPDFWRNEGFEARYGRVSKLWVVDLPNIATGGKTKPYFYTVDIDSVRDLQVGKDGQPEYIVINQDKDVEETERVLVVDASYWRIYAKPKNQNEYALEREAFHGLGFCPSGFVVNTPLDVANSAVRFSPLSPVLGLLDRYLDKFTYKDHYELYAAFALYWFYEFDNEVAEPQVIEDGGQTYQIYPAGENVERQKRKAMLGPGQHLRVPSPTSKEDADLRDPIGMVNADTGSLDYNQKELERSKDEILKTVTEKLEVLSKEAINEKQVANNTDGEDGILMWLANDIAKARKRLIDTLGKLRYGVDYAGCNILGGTTFSIADTNTAIETFRAIRTANVPQYVISASLERLQYTLTANIPSLQRKSIILSLIEPLVSMQVGEVVALYQQGVIDEDTMKVKVYFFDLLAQFENENGNIELFLPEIDFRARIDIIKKTFLQYAKERVVTKSLEQNDSNDTGN